MGKTQMKSESERNRITFATLIFSKDSFTKQEILNDLREVAGSIIISGSTASQFLETLVEIRALRLVDGVYSPIVPLNIRTGDSDENK